MAQQEPVVLLVSGAAGLQILGLPEARWMTQLGSLCFAGAENLSVSLWDRSAEQLAEFTAVECGGGISGFTLE